MTRMTFKAIAVVSLLVAIVLSFNLLVGAQDDKTSKSTGDKHKKDHSDKAAKDADKAMKSATGGLSGGDRKFIMEAAHGGMMEVELGRLATQKGASEDVKSFGQRMVDDHSKANDELMQLASQKGVMLPKAEDHAAMSGADNAGMSHGGMDKDHQKMMQEHQKVMGKLNALSGAEFDKEYMDMMVKDHTKAAAAFEKEAAKGGDPDVKTWASGKLPTLREHLQMARDVESRVKGKK